MIEFFARFRRQLVIIFLSCVPVIESRYAYVYGDVKFPELSMAELFILTQIGAFLIMLAFSSVFLQELPSWLA